MSYQVLYRKYRPKNFNEIVGQEYVVKTLQNTIKESKISHAYLFAGPRGTGKTSIAKLFAKAINCTSEEKGCNACENCLAANNNTHPDIIELDAASNNGVDDIRDIIEKVNYAPIIGKYKIYIIDEVHMLSSNAFNAFLKTLEEPPKNVIFILATTEPHKIIQTILSRCQRFNFNRIAKEDMKKRLIQILNQENISYEEEALDEIINLSDGGMRDVLSITEQVLAYGNYQLKYQDVINAYGLLSKKEKINILETLKTNGSIYVIAKLRKMYHGGIDVTKLANDLIEILKELLFVKEGCQELCEMLNDEDVERLGKLYNGEEIYKLINILSSTSKENKQSKSDSLSYLEVAFIDFDYTAKVPSSKTEKTELKKSNNETKTKEEKLAIKEIDINLELMLYILASANKEEKNHDNDLIFNNLERIQFDSDNYRFYNCLKDCKIFGSSHEAIILTSNNEESIHCINELNMNKALYFFLSETYNINKMIYALSQDSIKKLIEMYRNIKEYDISKYQITFYQKENTSNIEDKLLNLFGDKVRVEKGN